MGRYVFKLPDVGEGTAEAEIVAWHVSVGDHIKEDQQLVDVMTDKATVEMTSPVDGVIVSLHGEPGEMAPVGAALVEFEVEGATPAQPEPRSSVNGGSAAETPKAKPTKMKEKPAAPPPKTAPVDTPKPALATDSSASVAAIVSRTPGDKPLASPAVRQRANDLGIELQFIPGSGAAGRISHEDLDRYIATRGQSPVSALRHQPRDGVEEIKVIGLRRRIAERMQNSKRRIPHFAYVEEVDMTELEELRAHLNANKRPDQPKLNVLPFLMRALVRALPDFPQINARFDDEAGVVSRIAAVHIGIATQTVNGLLVPVVRHAEARDLWDAANEVARVAALTRDNKASKEDLAGSTITITSLGALGAVVTTPVINYPEVAIIGPNAILERPVVRNGQIVVRRMMNLSSSFDHRVVDGYDAAQFIQRMKQMLEHPATLFMD
jgi:2-oxoisovalerate dehydrogenase E2 component (dihydrolipoyl transacylase)